MKQKKVCILCAANIKHMTLISLYTDKLPREGVQYDIVYVDKYHEKETYEGACRLYRYEITINPEWPFLRKFLKYYTFKKYAKKILSRERYDFVVVWNEFTAFLFADYLRAKYKNRYSVNIRDENMNKIPPVQWKYRQALKGCAFSTISSDYFREIFPKFDYLFVHSLNKRVIQNIQPTVNKKTQDEVIRIMFIGRMSYPDTMKKVIDALGNDSRFELLLIGAGCENFHSYIKEKEYNNVFAKGAFLPTETASFLMEADIIYSLNAENDVHSDTLLPIKLYYAVALHIPILVFKSSYTYTYAKDHCMDIGVSSSDFVVLGDVIYKRYHELQQKDIRAGCMRALEEIDLSHRRLEELIEEHILGVNFSQRSKINNTESGL